jgi:perosamine synthetase
MSTETMLPKGPVLGWSSFRAAGLPQLACVENLPNVALLTSGRAAIYQALLQLNLPPGSGVLVPTYHCPTIVAPVLLARLKVQYFGIGADGLPALDSLDDNVVKNCRAIVVAHYFGLPKSLAVVRAWCDAHSIALIEDCAHCYFGEAGDRPVGAWGDYATASISKFFPVSEGGVLASSRKALAPMQLAPPGWRAQFKAWVDILEVASRHRRMVGVNTLLKAVFWLKNARAASQPVAAPSTGATVDDYMGDCDMARIGQEPVAATRFLLRRLPHGRIVAKRRQNFERYARAFTQVAHAHSLFTDLPPASAPYVFPLWVDDSERVYQALRELKMPVFRWDRIWPGTPHMAGDAGPLWSRHVLQLLCHQDLDEADVDKVAGTILALLVKPDGKTRPSL